MPANQRSSTRAGARYSFLFVTLLGLLGAASSDCATEPSYYRDLFPDTWVAHDAVGRNMPAYSVVGPVKQGQRRVVGIFYITWHSDSQHKLKNPYAADVSRVLASDP